MERPFCCARRGNEFIVLRRFVIANGDVQIRWFCTECQRDAEIPTRHLKHMDVAQYLKRWNKTLADIPVVADYSNRQPCIICGGPGEYHHWAPQALAAEFGDDWTKWPIAPLCRNHHMLWHHILTPYLNGR
jgi:hypothetical protein